MLLASQAAWAGIVVVLLTISTSGPRRPPPAAGAGRTSQVPAVGRGNDVRKMQQTLRDKGHYRGDVDGVLGLHTRASIRGFQKAENLPVTGQLDTQTAGKLGVAPEGRDETGYGTEQGKPSAGIKRTKGSARTSKAQPKDVQKVAALERDRATREQTLQVENDNSPQ
jgi:peptidoglycan hydrolase-like protein with peptidoglycan-binding domain